MLNGSPNDFVRQVLAAATEADEWYQRIQAMQDQIARITVTERSPDGAVEITMDRNGAITDMRFLDEARRLSPPALSAATMNCMHRANNRLRNENRADRVRRKSGQRYSTVRGAASCAPRATPGRVRGGRDRSGHAAHRSQQVTEELTMGGGGGYQVDPEHLRRYAATLRGYADMIGKGSDAANSLMTDNSVNLGSDPVSTKVLGAVGLPDTGRLDMAYGVYCQLGGIILEDLQQKAKNAIDGIGSLMNKLAANVQKCAESYISNEQKNTEKTTRSAHADEANGQAPGSPLHHFTRDAGDSRRRPHARTAER